MERAYVLFAINLVMWFYQYKLLMKTHDTVLALHYRDTLSYGVGIIMNNVIVSQKYPKLMLGGIYVF